MKLSNTQSAAVLAAYKEEIYGNPLRRMHKKDEQDVINFLYRALEILEVVTLEEYQAKVEGLQDELKYRKYYTAPKQRPADDDSEVL